MAQATLPAPLINARQVAELLAVPRLRVYGLVAEGVLPAVRIGKNVRFRPEAIQDFVERGGKPLSR